MLNIYYSKTVRGCTDEIFEEINKNIGQTKSVIFTPDRMTLQIEELLFEKINKSCFFDVDVTTLTRFTNKIVSNCGQEFTVLTKPVCVAIIKNILIKNQSKFNTIKRAVHFNGFASSLFDTISLFKSCNVTPQMLTIEYLPKGLELKLADLQLIYSEYESIVSGEYTDSFNKLNLLNKLIATQDLKDTNFYFLGYSDFTPQMYNVISQLVKHSASVGVACALGKIDELNNSNIYVNNIYLQLIDTCTLYGLQYNKVYCKQVLNGEFAHVSNNLFSFDVQSSSVESKNIELYKVNNIDDEVNFVVKYIQNSIVKHKKRYDDFVIVVPELSQYQTCFSRAFLTHNVPCFFDKSDDINTTFALRFYLDLFNLFSKNFNKLDVFNFLRLYTDFSTELLNEFEKYIIKSGFNYDWVLDKIEYLPTSDFDNIYKELAKIKELKVRLSKCKCVSQYIAEFIEFASIFNFENKLQWLLNRYQQEDNVLEFNKLNVVVNKINKGFTELNDIVGDNIVKLSECIDMIKAYFENVTIVMPPIVSNSVLIVDILKSEITTNKTTIVVGMQEGNMPIMKTDLGLISDTDMANLNKSFIIGPAISLINKRNKFKVFETLIMAKQLVCIYNAITPKGEKLQPCEAIVNLMQMFSNLKVVDASAMQHSYQTEFFNNYFEFNNINKAFALNNFIENLHDLSNVEDAVKQSNTCVLYDVLKNQNIEVDKYVKNLNFENNIGQINSLKKIERTSVSAVQTFYKCPYMYFAKYSLKLKESMDGKITSMDIGNIIHMYVEKVIDLIYSDCKDLELQSKKIFDKISKEKQYEYLFKNPLNKNQIKALEKETVRINQVLIKISTYSSLTPSHLENKFVDYKVEYNGNTCKLTGIVDRIDSNTESFVVYDYKSGSTAFKGLVDIKSGTNFQLVAYLGAAKRLTGKKPIGVYFIPLSNSYESEASKGFKLSGLSTDSVAEIVDIDSTLIETKVSGALLQVKRNGNGEFDKHSQKRIASADDFLILEEYSSKLIVNAAEQISNGVINNNPYKNKEKTVCEYCEFLAMCKYNEKCGNKPRLVEVPSEIEGLKD